MFHETLYAARFSRLYPLIIVLVCFVLWPAAEARALELQKVPGSAEQPPLTLEYQTERPDPYYDNCAAHLRKAAENHYDNSLRFAPQKAASLGAVIGLTFSFGSYGRETINSRTALNLWQPNGSLADGRKSLAMAAYKDCKQQKALDAISDFRWSR